MRTNRRFTETCIFKGRRGFFWQYLTFHVQKATRLSLIVIFGTVTVVELQCVLDYNANVTFCKVLCNKLFHFLECFSL